MFKTRLIRNKAINFCNFCLEVHKEKDMRECLICENYSIVKSNINFCPKCYNHHLAFHKEKDLKSICDKKNVSKNGKSTSLF